MLYLFMGLEQVKLASFVCNYNKGEFDHVSEEEAKNCWKNGKK